MRLSLNFNFFLSFAVRLCFVVGAFVFRNFFFVFMQAQSFRVFLFSFSLDTTEHLCRLTLLLLAIAIANILLSRSPAMIPVLCDSGLLQSIRPYNNYAIWTSPCYILLLIRLERFEARIRSKKPPQDLHQFGSRTIFQDNDEKTLSLSLSLNSNT